jgi:hypothetical protein
MDGSEAAAKAQADQKRKDLLAIWNSRRKKNPLYGADAGRLVNN